jgi:hypothetical protein
MVAVLNGIFFWLWTEAITHQVYKQVTHIRLGQIHSLLSLTHVTRL